MKNIKSRRLTHFAGSLTRTSKRFTSLMLTSVMLLSGLAVSTATTASALTFAADQPISRSGFITMLAYESGADTSNVDQECPFSDVENKSPELNWAYSKQLINGSSSTSFRPNDLITKQEAAVILGRYLDYMYTDLPIKDRNGLPDISDLPEWSSEEVAKCYMYGIIPAEPDNVAFDPKAQLTAQEAGKWISAANAVTESAVKPAENQTFSDSLTSKLEKEGNWSVSPYSVRMCLSMIANGAKGETRQELLNALQINDLDAFNADVKELLAEYDGYQKIMALNTANSMWINQSYFDGKGKFLDSFSAKIADIYRAETHEVTNADSVEKVNEWVNEKTNGKIPTIATEDNRNFATAHINAVYFKAAWNKEFDESMTKKGSFTNADGSTSETDFMHQTDYFGYYSTPGIQSVKLDYRNYSVDNEEGDNFERFADADFSMYLIKSDDKNLDIENLLNQAEFDSEMVRMAVPKFKIEYSANLNESLEALGIKTAFDKDKADFSDIIDPSSLPSGQYFLDDILHKTYVSIDEKGTEAAAVTAAFMGTGAAYLPRIREFTADEPFFFAIRDNTNKEILFVGRYESVK